MSAPQIRGWVVIITFLVAWSGSWVILDGLPRRLLTLDFQKYMLFGGCPSVVLMSCFCALHE
jgi:hypothetical protein